jgi:hypothetical protein
MEDDDDYRFALAAGLESDDELLYTLATKRKRAEIMAATKKRKSEGGEGETADDLEEHRAQDEIRTQEGQEGQEEGDERVVRAQLQDITK